jgi:hypothetical protein
MEGELFDIDLDSLSEDAIITDSSVEKENLEDGDTSTKDKKDIKKNEPLKDLVNLDDAVSGDDDEEEDTVELKKESTKPSVEHPSPTAEYAEAFASDLIEAGILQDFDIEAFKKITDPKEKSEALFNGVRDMTVSAIEAFIDSLEPGMKNIMLNYREGVSLKDIVDYTDTVTKWGNVTEDKLKEDQELRKSVIKQDLINRQYTPEKADKLAQRSIDLGEDVEDAIDSHKNVIAFENAKLEGKKNEEKQRQLEFEESKRKQIEDIRKDIETTDEIIPGVKLNKEVQDKIFKSITTIVGQDQEGRPYNIVTKKRFEDPKAFDKKLHYYIQLGLFDKTPDVSKLTKVAATKAVSKLEETIARGPQFKSGKVYDTDTDSNRVAKKILDMF